MKFIIRRKKIETGLMAAFAAVIVALALMLTAAACTNQAMDQMPEDGRMRVTAEASLPKNNAQTRTDYTEEVSGGMTVSWATNDAFTVFQGNTPQKFTLSKKDTDGTGHFTGSLTSGSGSGDKTLYALYPALEDATVGATTATSISLDIAAQTQASNKATTHLAAKDFMRSTATWDGKESSVAFGEFAHLMAVLRLDITLPELKTGAYNIQSIVLTGLDSSRTLDLTKDPIKESDTPWGSTTEGAITLTTTNGTPIVTTTGGTTTHQYTAYLMVFPTTGMKELTVKVTLDNDVNYTKNYTSTTGITLRSGNRYWITVKDLDNVPGGSIDGGDMGGGGDTGGIPMG